MNKRAKTELFLCALISQKTGSWRHLGSTRTLPRSSALKCLVNVQEISLVELSLEYRGGEKEEWPVLVPGKG